jgi:hypothetical protein
MNRAAARANRAAPRPSGGVRIGALKMSLPLPSGRAGERVAREAVARAAERLPAGLLGNIDRLELRVRPRAPGEAALTAAIAEALISALARHGKEPHA